MNGACLVYALGREPVQHRVQLAVDLLDRVSLVVRFEDVRDGLAHAAEEDVGERLDLALADAAGLDRQAQPFFHQRECVTALDRAHTGEPERTRSVDQRYLLHAWIER